MHKMIGVPGFFLAFSTQETSLGVVLSPLATYASAAAAAVTAAERIGE